MSTLGFYGGAGRVTGANFLLDLEDAKILIDCGMIQGGRDSLKLNSEPFAYNPAEIHTLFVTHPHADHIGRIPKLVRDGFNGQIISTIPAQELSEVMLRDAYKVMVVESKKAKVDPFYDEGDVQKAFSLWKTVEYGENVSLPGGASAHFTDAGHILGSAIVHVERNGRTMVFTGDLGNVPQPLMNPPEIPKDYDYLLMESVYGDRLHEGVETRSQVLKEYILDTQKKEGTLIIPAFSLERTQAMLLEINNFVERGEIEPIPVFLDSPLAISVTEIYRKYSKYFKESVRKQIEGGDDIFDFEGLSFTRTVKDSAEISRTKGAKIIIAGSGMSHGGRILAHEQHFLQDPDTTLLLVGYQAVGTLGRALLDGAKRVTIDGQKVKVRATIGMIQGYSGHADRDQLVDFVAKGVKKDSKVFVAMGEEKSSLFLVQRLRDYLNIHAAAPEKGEVVEVDM
ncbi:MBL fold metallo-hydrolase [Candidatus Kaiserbacteria bacterium]|nr:MBL fold metallo-hydrolase [Candidatus Kaiserbacteria bacterium]